MAWTTTTLLAHLRRVASLPVAATVTGYTDADLLSHCDAVLQGRLAPWVANSRDEHAVSTVDVAVASGQTSVRLPPRVAAGRLRDVAVQAPDGTSFVSMPRIEPEGAVLGWPSPPQGALGTSFYVQGGFLRLYPTPNAAMTLRLTFPRTPPTLAAVPSAGAATNITAGSPNVTFAHAAVTLSGAQDVVLASNGDTLGDSVPIASASSGSTQLAAANLSPLFVNVQAECTRYRDEGVYLCPAGTTCVLPLPDVASPLLVQRAAVAFLSAIGDDEAADRIAQQADAMELALTPLISERVEGEPPVVVQSATSRHRFRRL